MGHTAVRTLLGLQIRGSHDAMTRFRREQCGGYIVSIRTVTEVANREDIRQLLHDLYRYPVALDDMDILPYDRHSPGRARQTAEPTIDDRNGWRTHIVLLYGLVVGFTDGPVEE